MRINDLKIVINDVLGKDAKVCKEVLLFYLPCFVRFSGAN